MSDYRDEIRKTPARPTNLKPGAVFKDGALDLLATLAALADTDRDDLLSDIVSIATFLETVAGPRTGAYKRREAVRFLRSKWTELNANAVPNWLEDAAIGAVVDLVVLGLNEAGVLDSREVKVGIDARGLGRAIFQGARVR